jgi:conjugal transfer pilus assembly protein TraB
MSTNGLPDLPDEGDVKKRQQLIVALVVIVLITGLAYVMLTNPSMQIAKGARDQTVKIDVTTPGKTADPIQNWVLQNENRMKAYEASQAEARAQTETRMKEMMDQIRQLGQRNEQLNQQLSVERSRATGDALREESTTHSGYPKISLPPRDQLPVTGPARLPPAPGSDNAGVSTATRAGTDSSPSVSLVDRVMQAPDAGNRLVKIKFERKDKKKRAHIRDTIPAGSFGQAVMLSGLDAPTGGLAERNPHPVLLELIDNGNLPNSYRHRVKQCRVVGSGTGNISDERAYIRLERLTCVLKNGEVVSEVATGTVTGEDGKNGLRGNLVTKQGQLIANAFWAGALSGIGDAISQSYTTVATSATGSISTIDPNKLAETGLASGLGTTMDKIADWYFKRAEETYPIIEISAGRVVNLFLTEDLALGANLLSHYTPADE